MFVALAGWWLGRLFEAEVKADALHDVGDDGLGFYEELVGAEVFGALAVGRLR